MWVSIGIVGQELSGYTQQVRNGCTRLEAALPSLLQLPLGGTAIGTGLNAHPQFSVAAVHEIAALTHTSFVCAPNAFEAIAAHDAQVALAGVMKGVAVSLVKIANDLRHLGSGPRAGLGELELPSNEPGYRPYECRFTALRPRALIARGAVQEKGVWELVFLTTSCPA